MHVHRVRVARYAGVSRFFLLVSTAAPLTIGRVLESEIRFERPGDPVIEQLVLGAHRELDGGELRYWILFDAVGPTVDVPGEYGLAAAMGLESYDDARYDTPAEHWPGRVTHHRVNFREGREQHEETVPSGTALKVLEDEPVPPPMLCTPRPELMFAARDEGPLAPKRVDLDDWWPNVSVDDFTPISDPGFDEITQRLDLSGFDFGEEPMPDPEGTRILDLTHEVEVLN